MEITHSNSIKILTHYSVTRVSFLFDRDAQPYTIPIFVSAQRGVARFLFFFPILFRKHKIFLKSSPKPLSFYSIPDKA